MGKSLRELKEKLMALGGRTIEPNHRDFLDLKELINNMMVVRNTILENDLGDNYSGSTCIGHLNLTNYGLSESDIDDLSITNCACNTVTDNTPFCSSRTGVDVCRCNSRTSWNCSCEYRTACTCNTVLTCSCQSRTANLYYDDICLCHDRTSSTNCTSRHHPNSSNCTCNTRTGTPIWTCRCYNRTGEPACQCLSRTTPCSCYARDACDSNSYTSNCPSRTTCTSDTYVGPDCSSRTGVPPCQCDTRCACNVKNAFE